MLWLAALGVPLLLLLAWWPSGKPKLRPVLPNPNGYDYFVKAGGSLSGLWTNASHRSASAADLQAYLSANHASLELVREGLRHRSHTHMDYGPSYFERAMTNLITFKHLGRLLVGEGWLAELEGKPGAALDSYLDAVRLGQEASRGGLITERLLGLALEQMAFTELQPLIPKLDAQEARLALERLQQLDASHDAPVVNLAAEESWTGGAVSPWHRLVATLHPTLRKSVRDVRTSFAQKVDALQATRRRAIVEAAARVFELEKSRRPTGYADLVPAYLPAAPLDPTTGKEIAHPF